MSKKSRRINKQSIYLIFAVILVLLVIVCFAFSFKKPIQTSSFYADVIVMNHPGIDLNSSALTFGGVVPSSSASRKIVFENKYDFNVKASVSANGSIAKFMGLQKNWRIKSGETKIITISINVPVDTKEGTYDGYVNINIFKTGIL